MSATLGELVDGLEVQLAPADRDVAIEALCYDSRGVAPGSLFAALRGLETDGHRFVPQAIEAGAAALLVEEIDPAWPAVARAVVPDARAADGQRWPAHDS